MVSRQQQRVDSMRNYLEQSAAARKENERVRREMYPANDGERLMNLAEMLKVSTIDEMEDE